MAEHGRSCSSPFKAPTMFRSPHRPRSRSSRLLSRCRCLPELSSAWYQHGSCRVQIRFTPYAVEAGLLPIARQYLARHLSYCKPPCLSYFSLELDCSLRVCGGWNISRLDSKLKGGCL